MQVVQHVGAHTLVQCEPSRVCSEFITVGFGSCQRLFIDNPQTTIEYLWPSHILDWFSFILAKCYTKMLEMFSASKSPSFYSIIIFVLNYQNLAVFMT